MSHAREIEALRGDRAPKSPPPAPEARSEAKPADERALRCAACGASITSERARIEIHGAHEHRRVNPSGADFHVGCFADAPGCRTEGVPTTHWTWFPGCAWQIALCRACGAHLGWAFTGEAKFFGLILPRLRE